MRAMSFWAEYKSDTRDVVFYVGCEPVWEPAFCPSVREKPSPKVGGFVPLIIDQT